MRTVGRRAIASAVALIALLLAACTTGSVSGTSTPTSASGVHPVRTETRQVSGFTALTFSGIGQIAIQQTGQEKLTVTAQEDLLPLVTTTVSGNRLTIGFQGTPSPADEKAISYALQVKQLTDVEVTGTGNISAGGMTLDTLTTTVSGAGSIRLAGHAQDQKVTVSGTGIYDGSGFGSYTGTVIVSGAGSAVVNVTSALDAQVTGVGSIQYIGSPEVKKTITGTGSITQR